MKFKIEQNQGVKLESVIVWDAVDNKELCTFIGGEFETEDEAVISKLIELGYVGEEQTPDPNATVENELRAKAKALGIKSWHVKSIETLKEEIAEKEGAE